MKLTVNGPSGTIYAGDSVAIVGSSDFKLAETHWENAQSNVISNNSELPFTSVKTSDKGLYYFVAKYADCVVKKEYNLEVIQGLPTGSVPENTFKRDSDSSSLTFIYSSIDVHGNYYISFSMPDDWSYTSQIITIYFRDGFSSFNGTYSVAASSYYIDSDNKASVQYSFQNSNYNYYTLTPGLYYFGNITATQYNGDLYVDISSIPVSGFAYSHTISAFVKVPLSSL